MTVEDLRLPLKCRQSWRAQPNLLTGKSAMAFQSNGPVMLALPPFRGFTRRIILIAGCVWLAELVLGMLPGRYSAGYLILNLMLQPGTLAHGMLWQLVTYPFVGMGLLSLVFALLTVWFFGSRVEDDRGTQWMAEYFFSATIGGAVVATALCCVPGRWVLALNPGHLVLAAGMWPAAMAILVAFARFHGEEEIRLYIVLRVKAKYVALLYLGFYVLVVLLGGDKFGALVALANALCGWMFLKWVPRRGLRYAASEKWFGMRNEFYRAKRKKAAKEFEVYMRKQGKDVRVDDDDKKWMN
jgi:membrane associated rhomboid family serine protease